jgi:hypothetical protein
MILKMLKNSINKKGTPKTQARMITMTWMPVSDDPLSA